MSSDFLSLSLSWSQGETPKERAERGEDLELSQYLDPHQQMIQSEDKETAV